MTRLIQVRRDLRNGCIVWHAACPDLDASNWGPTKTVALKKLKAKYPDDLKDSTVERLEDLGYRSRSAGREEEEQ